MTQLRAGWQAKANSCARANRGLKHSRAGLSCALFLSLWATQLAGCADDEADDEDGAPAHQTGTEGALDSTGSGTTGASGTGSGSGSGEHGASSGTEGTGDTSSSVTGGADGQSTDDGSSGETNNPPIAGELRLDVPHAASVEFALPAEDPDGDALHFEITRAPTGSLVALGSGQYRYFAGPDFEGADLLEFVAHDGEFDSNLGNVHFNVLPREDGAPIARALKLTVEEDAAHPFSLPADDPDGDPLTVEIVEAPAVGTLDASKTGIEQRYTTQPDWNGTTSFLYRVTDGQHWSGTARVEIEVMAADDPPRVADLTRVVTNPEPKRLWLTAYDPDDHDLVFEITAHPGHGKLRRLFETARGRERFEYVADEGFRGEDTFRYLAYPRGRKEDGSASGLVRLLVGSTKVEPPGGDRSVPTDNRSQTIELAETDDHGPLQWRTEVAPEFGALRSAPSPRREQPGFVFTPANDKDDEIVLRAERGGIHGPIAVIDLPQAPRNQAPVAESFEVFANAGSNKRIVLRGHDPDGDDLRFKIVSPPRIGEISGEIPVLFFRAPASAWWTETRLTYVAYDEHEERSTLATITIYIRPDSGGGDDDDDDDDDDDGGVLHVDSRQLGPSPDGESWATAFPNLQAAIDKAHGSPAYSEIWVATGTYHPGECKMTGDATSYRLEPGIRIYGGFVGDETRRDQRAPNDPATRTILSGDNCDDDVPRASSCLGSEFPRAPTLGTRLDNAAHVLIAAGLGASAVLDGFTITGGSATTVPADCGAYTPGDCVGNVCPASIADCRGGGLLAVGSRMRLRNLVFTDNEANIGGGLALLGGGPELEASRFYSNAATLGAGYFGHDTELRGEQLEFECNYAEKAGGGLYEADSESLINASDWLDNAAEVGAALLVCRGAHCPSLPRRRATPNQTAARVGAGQLGMGSMLAHHNHSYSGAVFLSEDAELGIEGGTFSSNGCQSTTKATSGALHLEGSAALANVLVHRSYPEGGGIYVGCPGLFVDGETELLHATIADNQGLNSPWPSDRWTPGEVRVGANGTFNATNSIVHSQALQISPAPVHPNRGAIYHFYFAGITPGDPVPASRGACESCLIGDRSILAPDGSDPETGAPKFVSAGSGDYQIAADSPARDQGCPASRCDALPLDIAGEPRDAQPDMGCYEFQTTLRGAR